MGRLIATGVETNDHKIDISYTESADQTTTCVMVCSCGWNTPITPKGPWAVIEINARRRRHLREFDTSGDKENVKP